MPGMEKLHLEDAFEDGPQTRNLLRLFETDALMLRNYVVSLYRCFSRYYTAQKELCAATQALSSHLKAYDQQRFPLESDESILSSTLGQFAVFLDELSSVQQVLLTQLSDNTIFPINKFQQTDLDEIMTLKEVFQSVSDEHERILSTYMRFPKKKDQDKSKQEVIDDLYVARKKFHQTSLHYYTALNGLQYKRKASLLEPLIGLMNAEKTFFEIGRETILKPEVDEFVGNINASVQGVQAELKVASQTMVQQIETIEEESIHRYYAEPLPDMPHGLPNCSLSQKAGYLYLRSKPTLLSSRWDRCYFFIQGGNLMCQTKEEVAGSPILDLNEAIKVEAIESEDRRFVFQVVQLSSKKTIILQAENAFERNEWMATIANASKEGASALKRTSVSDIGGNRQSFDATETATSETPSSFPSVLSSVPIGIPKVFDKLRDSSKSSHPSTPPSSPTEGGAFYPDAPIQFDIITPCEEAKGSNATKADDQSRRTNPFNSKSGEAADGEMEKFPVRFFGSQQVKTDRGEPIILETVRQIMAARAIYNIFKMTEFQLAVCSSSLRLLDPANGNLTAEFPLKDVSYWSVHNENKRLFGFITRVHDTATPDKSTFTCYVFECNTSGEEICHAISAATRAAFQLFMQQESEKMQTTKEKLLRQQEKVLLLANINKLEDQEVEPGDGQIPKSDKSPQSTAAAAEPIATPAAAATTSEDQPSNKDAEKPESTE